MTSESTTHERDIIAAREVRLLRPWDGREEV
jgi:hypothetical protein